MHQNLTYNCDAPTLNVDFPNIDLFDEDTRTGFDTITMSFRLSGTDGAGEVTFSSPKTRSSGSVTLTIEDIQAVGYNYQPNEKTSADFNLP